MTDLILYADGACSGNPGPGGWAWSLRETDGVTELASRAGGAAATTNNEMELTAFRDALNALLSLAERAPGRLRLRLDSEYVLKGAFEWLEGWKSRGWKTASKKPVKNADLWREVDVALACARANGWSFIPEWVRGHAGEPGNEAVDTAAQEQAQRWKLNLAEDARVEAAIARDPALQGADAAAAHDRPEATGQAEVAPHQVETMRAILDRHAQGYASIADVIREIRANAATLGCR